MRKGVSKTTVKLLVTLAAAVLAAIIIIHHNPLADPQEETSKGDRLSDDCRCNGNILPGL